jgi:hypothetical protein
MSSLLQTNEQSFDDFFIQKKLEYLMDANNKKLAKEMANLQSMISQLNDEVREMKKGMTTRPVFVEQPTQQAQSVSQPLPEMQQKQVLVNSQKPSSDLRPRYGDYKSEDVSIDKFFYCGAGSRR